MHKVHYSINDTATSSFPSSYRFLSCWGIESAVDLQTFFQGQEAQRSFQSVSMVSANVQ